MFSLVITLISIALVAALALATLYYGGPVFNQGAARAHAAKIAAQGQQIQGAAELYKADNGEYPISLAELVAQNYLKSIPVAAAQEQVLLNNALAATTWVMVAPKTPVFALTGVSEATCKAVNLGSYGVEGILKTARQTNRVQCYGTSTGSLMIVQAKSPADLVAASSHPAAVIQVGVVSPAPIPAADSTDASDAGWLVAPGEGESIVTPPAVPQITYLDTNSATLGSLAFPATTVGETSGSQVVMVKNTGTASVAFPAQGATVPAPFAEVADTCASATLAPGASCTVSVIFTPDAAQSYEGPSYKLTLNLAGGSTANLPLTGVGASFVAAANCPLTYQGGARGGAYNLTSGPVEISHFAGWAANYGIGAVTHWQLDGGQFDIELPLAPTIEEIPVSPNIFSFLDGGHYEWEIGAPLILQPGEGLTIIANGDTSNSPSGFERIALYVPANTTWCAFKGSADTSWSGIAWNPRAQYFSAQ